MFLGFPEYRKMIVRGFENALKMMNYKPEIIAGTSTAGIPHATALANHLGLPLVYVRDEPKGHGLRNRIEGIDAEKGLGGREVLLIEDLVSTGGSSVKAVDALHEAGGIVKHCFSIFNYGFPKPILMFEGKIPYGKEVGQQLKSPCKLTSLLYYEQLLDVAIKNDYIKEEQRLMLQEWSDDQENWGDNHGFPRVKK